MGVTHRSNSTPIWPNVGGVLFDLPHHRIRMMTVTLHLHGQIHINCKTCVAILKSSITITTVPQNPCDTVEQGESTQIRGSRLEYGGSDRLCLLEYRGPNRGCRSVVKNIVAQSSIRVQIDSNMWGIYLNRGWSNRLECEGSNQIDRVTENLQHGRVQSGFN